MGKSKSATPENRAAATREFSAWQKKFEDLSARYDELDKRKYKKPE